MSMKSVWQDENGESRSVTSPVSCVISAFAPVDDTAKTLTPELAKPLNSSKLYLLDLSAGQQRLACSSLAQVYSQVGSTTADVDDAMLLKHGFCALQELLKKGMITAYHDRSDGGLIVAALEMAFASRCGLSLVLDGETANALACLFNEELGVVVQIPNDQLTKVEEVLAKYELQEHFTCIGSAQDGEEIKVSFAGQSVLDCSRIELHRRWSETSYHMQKMRDNPICAQQEYDSLLDVKDSGLFADLSFDVKLDVSSPFVGQHKPRIAILREQGVNGQLEMAAAFSQAGFEAIDVTMSDIVEHRIQLSDFKGLAACGGFSYGDVLGAGEGWAKSILFNNHVRDEFQAFFERGDAFALGVCNGCQMMSNLKSIIPGSNYWPHFVRNASEQYEARFVQAEILPSNSVLLSGMEGSRLPVVVAHGEGRAEFDNDKLRKLADPKTVLRFIDYAGQIAESYPANPNGSPHGIAGLSNDDGRITIMMPHPERIFRTNTNSWRDPAWGEYSPWMRMFRNARVWVD